MFTEANSITDSFFRSFSNNAKDIKIVVKCIGALHQAYERTNLAPGTDHLYIYTVKKTTTSFQGYLRYVGNNKKNELKENERDRELASFESELHSTAVETRLLAFLLTQTRYLGLTNKDTHIQISFVFGFHIYFYMKHFNQYNY
jgi:hypothetical protein